MSRPQISKIAPTGDNKPYAGHLFLRNVPGTTKTAFKAACASRNLAMRDVMIILMRKFQKAVRTNKTTISLADIYQLDPDDNSNE